MLGAEWDPCWKKDYENNKNDPEFKTYILIKETYQKVSISSNDELSDGRISTIHSTNIISSYEIKAMFNATKGRMSILVKELNKNIQTYIFKEIPTECTDPGEFIVAKNKELKKLETEKKRKKTQMKNLEEKLRILKQDLGE